MAENTCSFSPLEFPSSFPFFSSLIYIVVVELLLLQLLIKSMRKSRDAATLSLWPLLCGILISCHGAAAARIEYTPRRPASIEHESRYELTLNL